MRISLQLIQRKLVRLNKHRKQIYRLDSDVCPDGNALLLAIDKDIAELEVDLHLILDHQNNKK
jgi:hypothetical protein